MCNGLLGLRSFVGESFFLIRKRTLFPPAISAIVSVVPLCPDGGKLGGVEMAIAWGGELITRYMYAKEDNISCRKV